jgi:ubiquinol oxidase
MIGWQVWSAGRSDPYGPDGIRNPISVELDKRHALPGEAKPRIFPMLNVNKSDLTRHHAPATATDRVALGLVHFGIKAVDVLFARRYGGQAVVFETIAAVPPMVAATLLHLKCLRRMLDDRGWVRTFMDEAENQRAHLMAFVALQQPRGWERMLIALGQGVFYNAFFLLYLISARTAHRFAGYLSEQAVFGYSQYLDHIESDDRGGRNAPTTAIDYWDLPVDAKVRDMILAMREDEAIHRDLHHAFADALADGRDIPDRPGRLV